MSFPPYPAYKSSGVDWIIQVPEHWDLKRLKQTSRVTIKNGLGESAESDDPTQPRYVRITDIKSARELHQETFKSLSNEIARDALFEVGDILFACVGATYGKTYLHLNDIGPACYAGYLAKYSPDDCADSRFVSYWTESQPYWGQLKANVIQSTIQNFSAARYRELQLALPPKTEQHAIADFLDRETAKIDELVEEQQKLIELLQEKRQAVISHAVTKGLNPDAVMKDSGIEWLGQVPESWEVRRLKTILDEPLKYGANEAADIDNPTLPRFVRITDIDQNGFLRDETFKSLPLDIAKEYLLKEGDVLLARSGATVGKSFIYSDSWGIACYAGYLIRARLNQRKCLAKWLYLYCQTNQYWSHVLGTQIQATIQNVSAEKYASLCVPLPSIETQSEIISYLESELSKADKLTAEAERAITLLQERRSSLISAAVIGQIDVRTQN